MESSSPLSVIVEIPFFVRIYEGGAVERLTDRGTVPPSPELESVDLHGVASKDVVIDPETGVFVRIYLPRLHVTDGKEKLPVLVYVHGGGFCIESAASPVYHSYLDKVATEAKVVCISVEYRRTPEDRLPAAYDDCVGVLEWLDRQAMAVQEVSVDPWLASHADFRKVFVAGDSAGGNIVHQVGILASGRKWNVLCFQGAILVHPFFDGEEGIEGMEDFNKMTDAIWSISLPAGADKDHPFSNPVGPRSPDLSTLVYERMVVFVAEKDLLTHRAVLYYEALKKAGKDANLVMTEGEGHVFHLQDLKSENASNMMKGISDFINFSSD